MTLKPTLATFLIIFLAVTAFGMTAPGAAQGLDGLTSDSEKPVEIFADDGIEWIQDKKQYIARGNAQAKRDDVTVNADVLTAHYRDTDAGGTDIWRLDADGNVKITNPTTTARGDRGVFNIDKGILVLTGRNLKMTADGNVVTARDSLEFWQNKKMAVARGDAKVNSEGKVLTADILTAYFHDVAGKGTKIQRLEAFGNVKIETPTETATSDRGVYEIETGVASIYGSVKIIRDKNILTGEYGQVNLNTGVSRLLNATPGSKNKGRVRAVFSPKK
ncbi:MAG: hypothetical protein HOI33_02440, partial [Rhodospirillaceae bacterium]|nr:hypothetical protein [Rhodospirillaceae bacterium]